MSGRHDYYVSVCERVGQGQGSDVQAVVACATIKFSNITS